METKQTAIEWLHQISKQREPDKFDWEQAKQMEKYQLQNLIKWMYEVGYEEPMRLETDIDDIVEQYYNETYKN